MSAHVDREPGSGISPWLASLMLRRGGSTLPRFAYYYGRLSALSRGWRRRLRRKLAVTVTGAALLLAMGGGAAWAQPAAPEAVITVVNGQVTVNANGQCSLIEAIQNANNKTTGRPNNDCAAGNPNGADTINLPANGTFTVNNVHTYDVLGDIGLPWISSTITINGNGSTIQRNSNAPYFRLMAVGKNGNLTLNNTTVRGGDLSAGYSDATSLTYGGAGILNRGVLTVSGSTIKENYLYGYDYYGYGGGIANFGNLTISNSFVVDNNVFGYYGGGGGGVFSQEGSVTILNSTVSGNTAGGDCAEGGGIQITSDSTLTLGNSSITENAAFGYDCSAYGGGVSSNGIATIANSTFSANAVATSSPYYDYGEGGAIANGSAGVMTVTNSTITANDTDYSAGGIVNFNEMTITNTTITGNSNGGVLATCKSHDTITRLRRTIVSGNSGGEVTLDYAANCPGGVVANKNNVFGRNGNAGISGFNLGATDIVPSGALSTILSPLANNGGPTLTHALPAGSPALDRAPNADCSAAPVNGLDQRGQPRNQNGSGATGSNECDAGAFEREGSGGGTLPGFYASITGSGNLGGVAFAPADILKFDPTGGWSMFFDGSDVGITKNVTAFEIQNDGSLLLALGAKQTVAGVGTAMPQDVLRFVPGTTGNNTSGTFSLWVDGSTVGLTTTGEKIDTLGLTADGRLAIGATGAMTVPGSGGTTLKAQDEDALGFNRSTASWSNFFDGTPIPGLKGEDVNALWVNPATGELYVTIIGAFNVAGVAGDGRDILKLTPSSGATGGYLPSLVFDGSAQGLSTNIDALEMTP